MIQENDHFYHTASAVKFRGETLAASSTASSVLAIRKQTSAVVETLQLADDQRLITKSV